jgi:hypothetical protein
MAVAPFRSTFWRGAGKLVSSLLNHVTSPSADAEKIDPKHPMEIPPVDVTEMAMSPFRVALPVDFPDTIAIYNGARHLVSAIDQQLNKHGTSLTEVKRINLAYPHKDPTLFPGHYDNAKNTISSLQQMLSDAAPKNVQFYVVDEMVETVKLGRSEDQSSVHALTARQVYKIADDPQKDKPFHFKDPETGKGEFFLVVDGCVEQGTTLANIASYIALQGGTVLGAITSNEQKLVQRDTATVVERELVGERFRDPDRNTGRLVQLAESFAKSAAKDGIRLSAEKCLDIFEGRLNLFGNSVVALTDGECKRIIETMESRHYGGSDSFKGLIEKLDNKLKEYDAKENPKPMAQVRAKVKNTLRV